MVGCLVAKSLAVLIKTKQKEKLLKVRRNEKDTIVNKDASTPKPVGPKYTSSFIPQDGLLLILSVLDCDDGNYCSGELSHAWHPPNFVHSSFSLKKKPSRTRVTVYGCNTSLTTMLLSLLLIRETIATGL